VNLVEIAREIAGGKLTATVFFQACLERIGSFESNVNAFQSLDSERAKSIATQADATAGLTRSRAPLFGIPIGVKDIFPVRGLPCEFGSALYTGFVPDISAHVVEKIERAGAFVLGKTVTAEFAFLHPGKTRNPWNIEHTPGGSSSGSAAAVAAGFVPAAIGTQTNGSTIRPAAFCGIVGYKPSFGLISLEGAQPFSPTLDTLGIFTRSVADAALFTSCLADVSAGTRISESPPRLAAVCSPVWRLAQPDQRKRFAADIEALRAAGAEAVEIELPDSFNTAHSTLRTIMMFEGARTFRALRRRHRMGLSETLNRALDEGEAISESNYRAALVQREKLCQEVDAFLRSFDAIITPPAAGEAPKGLGATGDPAFCTIWTLTGVPAITIPTGLGEHGLPLGLQIVGRHRRDSALLATAGWCEKQLPFEGLVEREE
jgi:Asp-tRNA(Asn)/Glu-tRNA(Gln) amidotransferase A subunit family amidase